MARVAVLAGRSRYCVHLFKGNFVHCSVEHVRVCGDEVLVIGIWELFVGFSCGRYENRHGLNLALTNLNTSTSVVVAVVNVVNVQDDVCV